MRASVVMLGAVLGLTACGPIPLAQAERECLEQARLAERPRGEVGIFAGTGGVATQIGVTVSTDYLAGRDPEEVYQSCVLRRSGEMPRRPYRIS
jgi:hypothetical protein